jgi:hypothetical protein
VPRGRGGVARLRIVAAWRGAYAACPFVVIVMANILADTCGVEPFVVYLDFQAIKPLTAEDLGRISAALRPDDEESCVWTDNASGDLELGGCPFKPGRVR